MALVFNVRKSDPEVVKPAKPTPKEVKSLSDWDDRMLLRNWVSCITFYKSTTTSTVNDPAKTIKRALAEALVYYYPWAGRLKEQAPDGRLVVDCTAEGVLFASADADVTLDQFGEIHPPFPCMAELLYNKPSDSTSTIGCPIFVMQVTRLACGGFILAFTFNHVMSDVVGAVQFVTAISELARGALTPSVTPVWRRELLNARDDLPPSTRPAAVFLPPPPPPAQSDHNNPMTYGSFFFGAEELAAIRARLPQRLRDRSTSFELISACVFHCRAVSVKHAPDEQVLASFSVNARSRFDPPLPSGYYGNASFLSIIKSPMQKFHDLGYVLEQVKKAKESVTDEYLRSSIEEGAPFAVPNCPSYGISDVSWAGLSVLDFGWGKPVYAGTTDDDKLVHFVSFMVLSTNEEGEVGRLITLYMPKDAMDKFDRTLRTLLGSI